MYAIFKGALPLFASEKENKAKIWPLEWSFWYIWSSDGGPVGRKMGDVPPQEADGVGCEQRTLCINLEGGCSLLYL